MIRSLLLYIAIAISANAASPFTSDRSIDWSRSNIGVEGGIPNVTTIYTNLYPTGADDGPMLRSAVANCPSNQVVKIWGNLQIAGNLDAPPNGVVIRGIGSHRSGLIFSDGFIYIRNAGFSEEGLTNAANLTSDTVKGGNVFNFAAVPSWVSVGDSIILDSIADTNLVWAYNTSEAENPAAGYRQIALFLFSGGIQEARSLGQILKVTNKTATTIETELPINYTLRTADFAQVAKAYTLGFAPPSRIGFEYLKLEQTYSAGGGDLVRVENAQNCWWKDCMFTNSAGARHIQFAFCYRCEVRDSIFRNSHRYGSGQGYGIAFYHLTTACFVEKNIFEHLHNAVTGNYGANGNVTAYNVCLRGFSESGQNPSFGTHGVHCYMNLFEGNFCVDKVLFDWSHGSASHNSLLRNRVLGYDGVHTVDQIPFKFEYYNHSNTVAGSIFGVTGFHTNTIAYATNDFCSAFTKDIAQLGFFSFGCQYGAIEWDDPVKNATRLAANYDVVTSTNSGIVLGGYVTNDVPVSLIYTNGLPPSWWYTGKQWPPYSPTMGTNAVMTNLVAGLVWFGITNAPGAQIRVLNTITLRL